MDRVVVVRAVDKEIHTCYCGNKHSINVYARKFLGPVVGLREHNNGYASRMTDVREDAQGRKYHKRVTIDYFNSVSWMREDGQYWEPEYRMTSRKYGYRVLGQSICQGVTQ